MTVFTIYQDQNGEWRWSAKDFNNGNILAVSSEGYKNRLDCVNCAKRFGYTGN